MDLEKIILGTISQHPITGYEIRKLLERTTGNFYQMSYGSIYPILHRLEREGAIIRRDVYEGNKVKKSYSITALGRDRFLSWLKSPITPTNGELEFTIKLHFFENLETREVIAILRDYQQSLCSVLKKLAVVEQTVLDYEKKRPEINFRYKKYTMQYGYDYYKFVLDWVDNLIKKIEQGGNP